MATSKSANLISLFYKKSETNTLLDTKVDKVTGKGLSTNDFTSAYKTKLDNMESTIATAVGNLQLIEVVNALPTTDIKTNRLYLVPNTTTLTENLYDVYIRVNNKWEKIDSLEFDISNYPTKTEMNTALNTKMDNADYSTVTLSVTFADETTATYQLVKYIGGS